MITLSDEVCQVEMSNGSPCGRRVSKDKKKCILHLENKSDEEAETFKILFWKELERMEKDNDIKELDFIGFIFPAWISFKKHIFEKPVIFVSQFNNTVDFSDAQFKAGADFSYALFNEMANFSGALFNKMADFSRTQFEISANFSRTQFEESADFRSAQFKEYASFLHADFNDDTFFSSAQFKGVANFLGAQFNHVVLRAIQFNNAYFLGAQFNNEAYFSDSEFQGAVSFIDANFPSSDKDLIFFKNVKFHKPKDARFRNIDLSNVSFLYTDVSEVEFLNEKWARKNGRLIVADETRIGKDKSVTYGAVAQLYRRLRLNYESNYRFAEAGEFFIGEMEMRRFDVNTNIRNEKIKKVVLWFKRNFSLLGLYKHLSLYGESYKLPIIWAFIVIISYPMLMHWLFNASLPQSNDFLYTYLRTSAASFFQMDNMYIGERIIGVLIVGLLFIALKRKYERKK